MLRFFCFFALFAILVCITVVIRVISRHQLRNPPFFVRLFAAVVSFYYEFLERVTRRNLLSRLRSDAARG